MAARSALKLLSKTCHSKAVYCTRIRSLSATDHAFKPIKSKSCDKLKRSCSQPSKSNLGRTLRGRENFLQTRNISRSCENLCANRRYEDEEDRQQYITPAFKYYTRYEDEESVAQAPKVVPIEERQEDDDSFLESKVRYELAGSPRDEQGRDVFKVMDYFQGREATRSHKTFAHLQPNNMRPFGSMDNPNFIPSTQKKPNVIFYPRVAATTVRSEPDKIKKIDTIHYKQYSSYNKSKEYPGFEEPKKIVVCEKKSKTQSDLNKKNYSTVSMSGANKPKMKFNFGNSFVGTKGNEKATLKVGKSAPKKTAPAPVKGPPQKNKLADLLFPNTIASTCLASVKSEFESVNFKLQPRILEQTRKKLAGKKSDKNVSRSSSRISFLTKSNHALDKTKPKSPTLVSVINRKYNTQPDQVCNDYVTVKLSELQEQCRQRGECRPKKMKTNRLPKFIPQNCPCGDDPPMKEAKPLTPLKKRFTYPDRIDKCVDEKVCITPRADDNYKIKPKTLPKIEMADCPCIDSEMTDFVIKRLPKKKIPEPPKICIECVGEECCPERSDTGMKIKKKNLPKLIAPDCACLDSPEMTTVKLVRLKPKPTKEPERICPELQPCDITLRADHGLTIKPKTLPVLELNDCPCTDLLMPKQAPKLKRLKKVLIPEPSKELCVELAPCADAVRADDDREVAEKKLPILVPANCPCTEPEPLVDVRLKRLVKRSEPKEKVKVCPEVIECIEARADDGLEVKLKKLPEIVPGDCPCVDVELLDAPSLKRLIPKPVQEPEKICEECVGEECCPDRSDAGLKMKQKQLPVLPPGDCPCYEPPEMTDPGPLKKLKPKPVFERKKVCPVEIDCSIPRADENLKIEPKQLPILELNDCPCSEPAVQDPTKPLQRLKKVHIPEPDKKVCMVVDECVEIPRSDRDDWLYWKQSEVCEKPEKKVEVCEPNSNSNKTGTDATSKRNYSTYAGRHFDYDFARPLLYSLADLFPGNKTNHEPCSYNIDVRAPVASVDNSEYTRMVSVERKPIDYVGFIVYNPKQSVSSGSRVKSVETAVINTVSRFISSDRVFCKKNEPYLQPKNPIIQQIEKFMEPFPTPDVIEATKRRSRKYDRERTTQGSKKSETVDKQVAGKDNKDLCSIEEDLEGICDDNMVRKSEACRSIKQKCKPISLWQRIVNFFKARPNCPSAEEIRKTELKKAAEVAAAKAGLCVYDPACCKSEDLPKVITADTCNEEDDDEKK